VAQVLITLGAQIEDRDANGDTPLDIAVNRGFPSLRDLMIETFTLHRHNKNVRSHRVLHASLSLSLSLSLSVYVLINQPTNQWR